MPLFKDNPGDLNYIRKVFDRGVQIGEETHEFPLIVSPREIRTATLSDPVTSVNSETIEKVLGLNPEVVIVGSGTEQRFLPPETLMEFYSREVGIEVMKTPAACRTFNILVVENREVVAVLLPTDAT